MVDELMFMFVMIVIFLVAFGINKRLNALEN